MDYTKSFFLFSLKAGSIVTARYIHFSVHKLKITGTNYTQTTLTGFDRGICKTLGLVLLLFCFVAAAVMKTAKSSPKQH